MSPTASTSPSTSATRWSASSNATAPHSARLRTSKPAEATPTPADPPPAALATATIYQRGCQLLDEEMARLAAVGWSKAAIAR